MIDRTWVIERLEAWARDSFEPGVLVHDVRVMPGNSGISFGFRRSTAAGTERLVIRMPHPRAKRSGNADVLRQVAVLEAAASAGVPVPAVRFAADENPWFEVPFYVVSWVDGESTHLFDHDKARLCDGSGLEDVFVDGMSVLATLHAVDYKQRLPGWESRALLEEIEAWTPTLMKSSNNEWIDLGLALKEKLIATCPGSADLGLVHGDFYSNNWLYADGRIQAVVDWEIASIGAPGLDVGWIAMFYDDESWGPARHRWTSWSPDPDWLVRIYEQASGGRIEDIAWYRALAGYRMGCIAARAYDLHKSGKRPDPAWEIIADAYVPMLARASMLIS
ncbi:MAG TPA: phosphotransferase family protein [Nocardioidaceae bacterium]|nr:phosphotransferase family protein [Nocardioidaceae bacterium]